MNPFDSLRTALRRPYRSVTPAQAAALLEGGAILVDVREQHEWRSGHAPKARHIPLGALPGRMRELPARRTLVTVCHSGMRSARAAALLARSGREVVNVRGGMMAWRRAGLPLITPSGRR
jgi:rhodanese-related sulfurtransferase